MFLPSMDQLSDFNTMFTGQTLQQVFHVFRKSLENHCIYMYVSLVFFILKGRHEKHKKFMLRSNKLIREK